MSGHDGANARVVSVFLRLFLSSCGRRSACVFPRAGIFVPTRRGRTARRTRFPPAGIFGRDTFFFNRAMSVLDGRLPRSSGTERPVSSRSFGEKGTRCGALSVFASSLFEDRPWRRALATPCRRFPARSCLPEGGLFLENRMSDGSLVVPDGSRPPSAPCERCLSDGGVVIPVRAHSSLFPLRSRVAPGFFCGGLRASAPWLRRGLCLLSGLLLLLMKSFERRMGARGKEGKFFKIFPPSPDLLFPPLPHFSSRVPSCSRSFSSRRIYKRFTGRSQALSIVAAAENKPGG